MHKFYLQPVINKNVIWRENDGEVVLIIENKGVLDRILQFLVNKPKKSYIHLDEIGSYIWKMIDGENTVFEIGYALENEFNNSVFPVYERLAIFLSVLRENRFITFRKK